MGNIKNTMKKIFWKLPLPGTLKENLRVVYAEKKFQKEEKEAGDICCIKNTEQLEEYAKYVLCFPNNVSLYHKEYEKHINIDNDSILVAYYLTQYSPDPHNDLWWGKGTTEWNNVSKAVPQFVGHRQPLLPGELGFYDLRLKEVMRRQIEIAKNYGINAFSFYYYWFADERILEKPLKMFLEDKSLDMSYMFCWANENWTRRFSGTDAGILIGMDNTVDNYKKFIHEVIPYFDDPRYLRILGKPVLQIYRPTLIPEVQKVINYWRKEVKDYLGNDIYVIATQTKDTSIDWISQGFDAENEWMPASIQTKAKEITNQYTPIRKDFKGEVYDYEDLVTKRKYIISENRKRKVYPAVMPSWDNSARRNNKGLIWMKSNPNLYRKWLKDILKEVNERKDLDVPMVFINAWNEWGEGAYLEPDRDYGYAYLEATWEAKNTFNK